MECVDAMQLLFLLVAIGGLIYLLTGNRRVDLFALAFAAACVYFLPGFFGAVPDGVGFMNPVDIERETYAVMTTVLSAILMGAWLWDSHGSRQLRDEPATEDRIATLVAFGVATIGFVMTVWTGGEALYSAHKDDVLEASSRWMMLFSFSAALAAVLAFTQRQWIILTISVLQLLFTVYIGFRSYAAITLMAILLVHFQRQGTQRIVSRNLPAMLFVFGAGSMFLIYKCLYILVKMGDFGRVRELLANPDFYLDAVIGSEPFTTQMVLNECLRTGFETDVGYIFVSVLAQLTLFSAEMGFINESFNDLFQPQLFPEVEYGLAANIWAQMLCAGGWPLFLGFLAVFVWTLRLGSIWMSARRVTTRSGIALVAAYWAFYIHRNDLGYELSLLKRVLIVWGLVALISETISRSAGRTVPKTNSDADLDDRPQRRIDRRQPAFGPAYSVPRPGRPESGRSHSALANRRHPGSVQTQPRR